jgi:hypothetical protein
MYHEPIYSSKNYRTLFLRPTNGVTTSGASESCFPQLSLGTFDLSNQNDRDSKYSKEPRFSFWTVVLFVRRAYLPYGLAT